MLLWFFFVASSGGWRCDSLLSDFSATVTAGESSDFQTARFQRN